MSIFDYIIDSALVLLVVLQFRERPITARQLIRPLVILGVAMASYLQGIPTAGNDLVLVVLFGLIGAAIGTLSGVTVIMGRTAQGAVTFRSGVSSAFFWVLGMGSRFAFVYWITHSGAVSIAHFSATHSITSGEAWTVALLAMAFFEVISRTVVMGLRWRHTAGRAVLELA